MQESAPDSVEIYSPFWKSSQSGRRVGAWTKWILIRSRGWLWTGAPSEAKVAGVCSARFFLGSSVLTQQMVRTAADWQNSWGWGLVLLFRPSFARPGVFSWSFFCECCCCFLLFFSCSNYSFSFEWEGFYDHLDVYNRVLDCCHVYWFLELFLFSELLFTRTQTGACTAHYVQTPTPTHTCKHAGPFTTTDTHTQ